MFYKKLIVLLSLISILLVSCGFNESPAYNQAEGNVADTKLRADAARQKSDQMGKPLPSLVVNQGQYVDKTPISLARQPTWLKNKIIIRGDQLPFSYYSRTIVSGGDYAVLLHYQTGLDEKMPISMNYSGTVKGALDLLASKAGYVYSVDGNNVTWQAFVTRSFDIAFMPGSSDYMMGKASGSGSSSSVGTGSGTVVTGIVDDSASSQFSSLKGTLSVWDDLTNSVKQLLSPDGKVMVSQATTSVTVRDRPSNVALVGRFIANLNHRLSKQVLIKIQVLDVSLSNAFNFGIDWNIIGHAFGGSNYMLNASYGTPISITPLTGESVPQGGLKLVESEGVGILINALEQQGKVSIVTEPRVVCLNNQVSVIRITQQQGYLASVENTTSTDNTSNSVTSQITPGTVVTGFTLYVLPKILDGKVYLQVNADLSANLGIQTISSENGLLETQDEQTSNDSTIIQVPNVTDKQFNQRSVISSGDTLILAGFRQTSNTANAMQLLKSQTLGGKASNEVLSETILLITPIILNGA